jgi:hypothetical protein
MARQPDKGKSAIQMLCDMGYEVSINNWGAEYIVCGGRLNEHAYGTTPELAARALLTILRPAAPAEKKKLDRGGVK